MNSEDIGDVTWNGALWRNFYDPKPAPPIPRSERQEAWSERRRLNATAADTHAAKVLAFLQTRALSIRDIAERTGLARSSVQVAVQYLRREGKLSVIAKQKEGAVGRSSAVYTARKSKELARVAPLKAGTAPTGSTASRNQQKPSVAPETGPKRC